MTREERLKAEDNEKARRMRLDMMRDQVQELELQARYWKANHDTKYYTLEDAKLKEPYEKFFYEVQEKAMEAARELEASPDPNLTVESSVIEEKGEQE